MVWNKCYDTIPRKSVSLRQKRHEPIKDNVRSSLPNYLLLTWEWEAHGAAGFGASGILEGFHGIPSISNKLGPGVC